MMLAKDVEAAERWQRRQDSYRARPGKERSPWARMSERLFTSPEQRSAARIEALKQALLRNRYSSTLKKRLKRAERLHAARCLLGWKWLYDHPEHELSPEHQDWLKWGPKQQL